MKQFFLDLLKERRNGKFSSKKFWGHIFMTLVGTSYILDGLHFYDIDNNLFNTMVIAGSALIGARIIADMFKRKPENSELEETTEKDDKKVTN